MKVIFVINSLAGGGAERVFTTIVRFFSSNARISNIQVVTLDDEPDKYQLPSSITRHSLSTGGSTPSGIFHVWRILRAEKPDVVVSFLTRANIVSAICGFMANIPTIISERVNTTSHFSSSRWRAFSKFVVRLVYSRASHVICVSEGVKKDLNLNFGIRSSKLTVISNPFDLDQLVHRSRLPHSLELPKDYFISIGRLVENKGTEVSIKALARLPEDVSLVIVGDGPLKDGLTNFAQGIGLTGRVKFLGHMDNPHALIPGALGYVSASRAEGFPNALVEAMSIGCPVISTDCESGPSEILHSEPGLRVGDCFEAKYGLLVPVDDDAALAKAMNILIDPTSWTKYGRLSRSRAGDYELNVALRLYETTILGTIHER